MITPTPRQPSTLRCGPTAASVGQGQATKPRSCCIVETLGATADLQEERTQQMSDKTKSEEPHEQKQEEVNKQEEIEEITDISCMTCGTN